MDRDMTHIRAELSQRKKHRNAQEWRNIPTATAEGITVESDGLLMPKLALAIIDAGKPPTCTMSAHRGATECLPPFTLAEWASGSAGKREQPAQLRRAEQ